MVVTTLSRSDLISTNSNHYVSSHNQLGLLIELNYYSKKSKVLVVVTVFKRKNNTVVHDFNGHEVNGKHGFNGKKCCDGGFYVVNNGKIDV